MYLSLLLSALALALAIVSIFYFRSYLKKRTGQERILSEMREEVDSIMREMDEAVERDISLIEERKKNLKTLLDEIDRRLKVYIREMEKLRNAEETSAALSKRAPEQTPKYQDLANYRFKRRPVEDGQIPSGTAAELPGPAPGNYLLTESKYYAPATEAGEKPAAENPDPAFPLHGFSVKKEIPAETAGEGKMPPEDSSQADPVSAQIHSLVRAGLSAPLIASHLGISIAEVEFAAALLERRDAL